MCDTLLDDNNDDNIKYNSERKRFWHQPLFHQVFFMLAPISSMFSAGIALGTVTVLIPELRQKNQLKLTEEMESWLYSVHGFAALPAIVSLPILSDCYGRRLIYLMTCVIITVSWVIQYFAENFESYLTAEILQGVNMAGNTVIGIIYISECSNPKYRGIFLVLKSASYVWGIWIANTIGTFTDSKYNCIIGFISALYSSICLGLLPESPVWLASKNRFTESKKSFFWFRGTASNDITEFQQTIFHYNNNITKQMKNSTSVSQYFMKLYNVACLREFYLPFSLSVVCCGMYQFCGKIVIAIYALVIIKEITNDISLAYKIMLTIDAFSVMGLYMGCYLVFKLKRRVLLFSTSFAGSCFMYIISFLLFMIDFNVFKTHPSVMLVLLVLYSFAVSLGPMSVSTSIFAEIVPFRFKKFIVGVATITFFGFQSLFLKCNPYLMKSFGLKGIFLLYACLSSLALLFLYCYLPETKDRTLTEIENKFSSLRVTNKECESNLKEIVS